MKKLLQITILLSLSLITFKKVFANDELTAEQANVEGKILAVMSDLDEISDEELELLLGNGKIEAVSQEFSKK